jgi:N-acetylglucosaminyldiphosphoundecaprenol N-acetyl-beta-D-mannosaminyltransferase
MSCDAVTAAGFSCARIDVLGVPVSAITMAQALEAIDTWIACRTPQYICVTGVHGVMESGRDESLRAIHARAGLVTPDGMPLVWLARHAGQPQVERVYGPDLMLAVCSASVPCGWRHFFYGGSPGVAGRMASRLQSRFPGLQIAGEYAPPFHELSTLEDKAIVERINATTPDLVWVGLSTPKQERWMAAHVGRLTAPVLIGVGAAFDFHAGVKRQAPRWMQRSGLEWSFRLMTEPRRLWKRYLVNNPQFVWRISQQLLRPGDRAVVRREDAVGVRGDLQ